ncbi:MAG: PDZ domain-containing protein [Polyangiaceae bacterium]
MITEPAHARIGLGMRYELRTQSVFITRVVIDSPAARAGLRGGEEIVRIQSKDVKGMDEADARSLINANAPTGVSFTVKKADGSTLDVSLREGPIYPTLDDDVPIE